MEVAAREGSRILVGSCLGDERPTGHDSTAGCHPMAAASDALRRAYNEKKEWEE